MSRFSIRFRMVGAIVVVLGLLFLLGGAGMVGMQRIQSLSENFIDHVFSDSTHLSRLQYALGRVRLDQKDMILQYETPMAIKQTHQRWLNNMKRAQEHIDALSSASRTETAEFAQGISKRMASYANAFEPVVQELDGGGVQNATIGNAMAANADKEFLELEALTATMEELVQKDAINSKATQVASSTGTKLLFGLVVLVSVLIVVPLTLLNMKSICIPLEQARVVALAISTGDLAIEVPVSGRDEVSDLLRALELMRSDLADTVGILRKSSERIALASLEIVSGNDDLALRTERAAFNVQSMSSSISELMVTVQQTADSAKTADQLASAASNQAENGGLVVAQVVTSMHEIASSSSKIADIISLIDSIAFQTNILALNAAVEAARAGEQGRGFAVVASEVRVLAQRSALAAREIKTLIKTSVGAVDNGVRLATQAGEAMSGMVSGVQLVGDIVRKISTASTEQSDGIADVNATVHEIDNMTQQNAALVEQSTAASASLQELAGQLTELVRQFKLRANGGVAHRPPQLASAVPVEVAPQI